jgi:tetraacyldisaccharide 4'-kinase
MFSALLEKTWWAKKQTPLATLLTPFAALHGFVISVRRELYSRGLLSRSHPGVPVLAVGNIVVGGAGKTPVVQAIVRCLQQAGYRPGIISRGYPVSPKTPRTVTVRSIASDVGDEPLLHFTLGVPVVVCADRVAAAMSLLEQNPDVNVLVADDALQHYALMRDIEIEVISAERRYGNGKLMPAGPLREPRERARVCQLRLMPSWITPSEGYKDGNHHVVRRKLSDAYALVEPARKTPLATFAQSRPAIVAGIANPRQFYDALLRTGVQGQLFGFSDHYNFRPSDFASIGERSILMTEKDAAKCRTFADRRMWVVPLTVHFAPETKRKLLLLVRDAAAIYAPTADPVGKSTIDTPDSDDGPETP